MHPDTTLLDRYELRDRLGRGGMGTVYRAYDRQLGRFVAVKVFAAGQAGDDLRRRSEATALARLSHPNLVTLLDAHLSPEGDPAPSFLVMELVDGEDLRGRLDRGPLPGAHAAAVAEGIAEALVVVHGAGMVHRDLKPANILLSDPGVPGAAPHPKLADFGIAHLIGTERLTTAGTIIGTAGYLSPEQASVAEPGPAADIYALGLVTLESLTGVTEYPGTPLEAITARLARDPRIPRSLPEDWRGLLGAMTARDPATRPTALEVAVMARELAPQLAGWTIPWDDGLDEDTVAMPIVAAPASATAPATARAAAPAVAAAPALADTAEHAPALLRRRIRAGAAIVAAAVAVGLAVGLGSVLAPAFTEPVTNGQAGAGTPRPTPTVSAPPQTIAPAVSTPAPQQVQQAPAPAPAPAPAQQQGGSNKGSGNSNGKGNGKGKGGG